MKIDIWFQGTKCNSILINSHCEILGMIHLIKTEENTKTRPFDKHKFLLSFSNRSLETYKLNSRFQPVKTV